MKTSDKQELQRITIYCSSDTDSKDFLNVCKKCSPKLYSFLVIDTALTSGNLLLFRCNLLARIENLMMIIDDKIRDDKLQYDINRKATKLSALSWGKIDKYECLTNRTRLLILF